MATSSYYVPDSSYFPIVASFGLIGMAAGGGGMMNHMRWGRLCLPSFGILSWYFVISLRTL
jgi:hypothetical protein